MSYNIINKLQEGHIARLHELYQLEWWTRGRNLEDVRAMVSSSEYLYGISAFGHDKPGELVGFVRVLSDRVFKALIFDVVVDPAHRGRALGRQLMERILSDPRLAHVKHFELYCLPELEPFYERLGFSADVGGVRLMRLTHYSL